MKVTLYPDYPEENWPSMKVYHRNLKAQISHLRSRNSTSASSAAFRSGYFDGQAKRKTLRIKEYLGFKKISRKVGHFNLKTRLIFRFLLNPLLAPFHQEDINHILDQSYGHLVFFLNPKKTVVTCHDLNPLKFRWKKGFKEKIKKWLYVLSLRGMIRSAKIISVSQATKNDLIRFLNCPEEKIVVIPQGARETFKSIKNIHNISIDKLIYKLPSKFILYVGHSGEFKNIKGLLKTFNLLLKEPKFSQFSLVKIGEEFSPPQKQLIKKLKIQDKIIHIPYASQKDLVLIYNKARCLLHLSLMEGFGATVLEAMKCGCPVVCSDIPALRELTAGKLPLIKPDDYQAACLLLKKILKDQKFREKLGQIGLKQAEKFTWQKTGQKTFAVYQSLFSP